MSTKSTLILSSDNEHVYYDCSDNTVNIEVNNENVEYCRQNNGAFLSINANCDLGRQLQLAYNDPDTFPRMIIERLIEANDGYNNPKFKEILDKITDLQSCIHIIYDLFSQNLILSKQISQNGTRCNS